MAFRILKPLIYVCSILFSLANLSGEPKEFQVKNISSIEELAEHLADQACIQLVGKVIIDPKIAPVFDAFIMNKKAEFKAVYLTQLNNQQQEIKELYFWNLPFELQWMIFAYLKIDDILSVGKANKAFNKLTNDDSLWRHISGLRYQMDLAESAYPQFDLVVALKKKKYPDIEKAKVYWSDVRKIEFDPFDNKNLKSYWRFNKIEFQDCFIKNRHLFRVHFDKCSFSNGSLDNSVLQEVHFDVTDLWSTHLNGTIFINCYTLSNGEKVALDWTFFEGKRALWGPDTPPIIIQFDISHRDILKMISKKIDELRLIRNIKPFFSYKSFTPPS